ncbi:MAG: Mycothiol acetyltransferase [Chlamydiae bacterium]|nr:Mycothiol acetyltransferase [Chlamydiota bacterium]
MGLEIISSRVEDSLLLKELFQQPDVLQYFPMEDLREIDDSVRIWEIFCRKGASLTSVVDGVACGLAFLNLQPYKKFAHQCLITIIVDDEYRGKGIGTALMHELMKLSKEKFSLEMLHLEVYESNPAIRLYERLGFEVYGVNKRYIKEKKRYIDKILMQKWLISR